MDLKITEDRDFMVSGSTEVVSIPKQVKIGRISGSTFEEAKANARFVSEAFHVHNILRISPPRLLDLARKAALNCVEEAAYHYGRDSQKYKDYVSEFKALL